jgi:hypothetical protein
LLKQGAENKAENNAETNAASNVKTKRQTLYQPFTVDEWQQVSSFVASSLVASSSFNRRLIAC